MSFKIYSIPGKGLVPDTQMTHIGIVVKDIDQALSHWVDLLGIERRPDVVIAEGHSLNPTQYRGKPSNAKAKLAFLRLQNLQVELIEPIGNEPSHWREFLERKGGGVHHVAFEVKGMEEAYVARFKEKGYDLAQHGGWDGGEYGYMDGLDSLGVMVELIERYK
ncbi:MAG: VOC family protein [Saprospiraceae bacterium]